MKMNFLKVIRNNWKKSAFAAAVSGYALSSLKTHIDINQHMREFSTKLSSSCKTVPSTKKVLVVINPIANNKKSEKTFKKYCEPILHLAGYSVELLRTNHIGHAKAFIEEMAVLPDAIVIAGGDGTSSEVVTGLMRRNENRCPITILPLGRTNQPLHKYFHYSVQSELDYIKSLCSALLPMLREEFMYQSVIRYDVINDDADSEKQLKPIFGLNGFSWGLLKDIDSTKEKYWYFGPIRHYVAAFSKLFSKNWSLVTDYVYTPPCSGCADCFEIPKDESTVLKQSFFGKLVNSNRRNVKSQKQLIKNSECSNELNGKMEANQIDITCIQNNEDFSELETNFISSLQPGWNFIKTIPSITCSSIVPQLVLRSRTIQLYPNGESTNDSYSIDGEEYDARPIKLSVVPNAIKVFC
ncbi:acylglycerol kinase, mitochondrial [Drosophila guanche]|uniref:Acylglycerol kinase, mitochondrial n=1 Tax=Drosophila guanche TaxID=7266 RepID=A0A3B0JMS8_DROGU|nr:acylglycerol kinase, mitochondrial [Drosophila guanche]SPP81632.1 blast:Acylglycerol kinase%2C mitochondrial [Drosophila guanche]